MYKAALDVHYQNDKARAVCILFRDWKDNSVHVVYSKEIAAVQAYEPGAFYKRELPCLLQVLTDVEIKNLEVVIIDGYVYLDDKKTFGLGGYLYEAVHQQVPVIGVAKTRFYNNTKNVVELKRGSSKNPLYITAIGIEVQKAAENIGSMAGTYRVPDLLKQLDRITRGLKA